MLSSFWKTTLIYGMGFIGLRMISFLLLPLYTHLLTPAEAGIVFIIYTVLAFLNTIYSRGLDAALFKFYTKENSITATSTSILYSIKHGSILSLLLLTLIIGGFATGLIPSVLLSHAIIIGLIAVLFCDMLSSRCMSILRLEEQPFYYLLVSLINIISNIILNIYLIKMIGLGLEGAIWAIIIASFVQLIVLIPVIIKRLKFNQVNLELLVKMKNFSWPFMPAAIFLILIELSDRWMISLLSANGIADVGIYSTGYKFGSLIMLCVRAFNLNWQPYYLKKNTEHNFYKIGSIFLSFLIILSTLLSLLWPSIFYFLIGKSFWDGGYIIPIITISYIFYGLFILQMPSLYLKNKEQWAPWFWGIGFIINACCNCALIPLYGYYGAAFATLFAYTGMALYIIYKNSYWMPMTYNLSYILSIMVISVLSVWFGFTTSISVSIIIIPSIYCIITMFIIRSMYKKL